MAAVGDRTYRPTRCEEVRRGYQLGAGRLEIDLRGVPLPAGDTHCPSAWAWAKLLWSCQRTCAWRPKRKSAAATSGRLTARAGGLTSIGTTDPHRRRGRARLVLDAQVGLGALFVVDRPLDRGWGSNGSGSFQPGLMARTKPAIPSRVGADERSPNITALAAGLAVIALGVLVVIDADGKLDLGFAYMAPALIAATGGGAPRQRHRLAGAPAATEMTGESGSASGEPAARRALPDRDRRRPADGGADCCSFARPVLGRGTPMVWPAAVAAVGALLIWRAPDNGAAQAPRLGRAQPSRALRERSSSVRAIRRPEVSRGGLGVALGARRGLAFLWANGAMRPAGEAVLAGLAVLVALALIFAPSWRRLAAQPRGRESRAHSLTGARRRWSPPARLGAADPGADSAERGGPQAGRRARPSPGARASRLADRRAIGQVRRSALAAALEAAAAEVEETAGVRWRSSPSATALDGRAAPRSRGRARGDAERREVRVARAGLGLRRGLERRVQVFVRDRGAGFDPAARSGRAARRAGVDHRSHAARRRPGGGALLAGRGTEVEITVDRGGTP